MPLPTRARMYRYFQRIHVGSESGEPFGYFRGRSAYFDNGQFTCSSAVAAIRDCVEPFPLVALDPPTIELDDPQNYEGFVPIEPMAAQERYDGEDGNPCVR